MPTSLETEGRPSSQSLATNTVPSYTPSVFTSTFAKHGPKEKPEVPNKARLNEIASGSTDAFLPIATDAPPSQITPRGDHPVSRLGIVSYTLQSIILSTHFIYKDTPSRSINDQQVLCESFSGWARTRSMDTSIFRILESRKR